MRKNKGTKLGDLEKKIFGYWRALDKLEEDEILLYLDDWLMIRHDTYYQLMEKTTDEDMKIILKVKLKQIMDLSYDIVDLQKKYFGEENEIPTP
jgi:hypothetical protein